MSEGSWVKPAVDREEMRRALALFVAPGEVVELRALEVSGSGWRGGRTRSGYFSEMEAAVAAAMAVAGDARGVYFTPNPVLPALLARAQNRLRAGRRGRRRRVTRT